MRAALLVAAREFRQIIATRGFWVMLLIVPLALAASIAGATIFGPQQSLAFTLVDASGRYAPQIERRLELDYQREVLRSLAAYAERWNVAAVDPGAPWARRENWSSDAEVARFMARGGAAAALGELKPRLPEGASPFKPPHRAFVEVPPPRDAPIERGAEAFGQAVTPALGEEVQTPAGKRPLALAVYIPKNFGAPGAVARMWTGGRGGGVLVNVIRDELTAALRIGVLQASGVSPTTAAAIDRLSAPVQVSEPPADAGPRRLATRSLLPLALVYLLLITAMTTGSLMLQGLVEERSNKLLESVLACIRPGELMVGKLLGLGAVGLLIALMWAACAVLGAVFGPSEVGDLLRPSLMALDQPAMIAALIFYFLSGYLILAALFLAIGSVSDSMQDAQSYLMPVMVVIMLPIITLMQASVRSPDSALVHVLSWIPLYTPFAMLARLGAGVSLLEMIATGVILVAFVALELVLLGRVFRASLLSAGQPAKVQVLARLMFAKPEQ